MNTNYAQMLTHPSLFLPSATEKMWPFILSSARRYTHPTPPGSTVVLVRGKTRTGFLCAGGSISNL